MTLGELGVMPLAEYHSWCEFGEIEPWGSHYHELRADVRAGKICATVANWAGKQMKEGKQPLNAADFMESLAALPAPEEPVLLDDPEAQSALILAAFGKTE